MENKMNGILKGPRSTGEYGNSSEQESGVGGRN